MQGLLLTLDTVIGATAVSSDDKHKLLALVQDGEGELGAPAGATYKTHSTNIVEVLEDLKEKAEGQLAEARKAETSAKQNYDMLAQSLNDELAAENKKLSKTKSAKAEAEEAQATAE